MRMSLKIELEFDEDELLKNKKGKIYVLLNHVPILG
ncbi:hypothetical protein Calni_2075 (plasmid) [Calditerrivibrio nitroreducens DSM 19672]|uniref:Uncharacterized protein n=1 Tax=Calditerrivibrio nitroreducens (strain DSM 19672 / NBRC 101217 / Yu37-1) TaxID=768670 RepID=E4TK95_CALNY|nr:hypothetical protein Calni_2075 [Calditerrivibrio nitroreducens DSM 19672]